MITKSETKNIENKNLNVNLGGVTLSEGYSAKNLLKDIEEYSLSHI